MNVQDNRLEDQDGISKVIRKEFQKSFILGHILPYS